MPLQKNTIPVSLKSGLNLKTDSKQLMVGELIIAENLSFQEGMAFNTRNGFQSIGNAANQTLIGNGAGLATYKEELIQFDGIYLNSLDVDTNTLKEKGNFVLCQSPLVSSSAIVRSGYVQNCQDSAISSVTDLQFFCWEDSFSNSVRYSILDGATGQAVVNSVSPASNSFAPKVAYYNGYFHLFYLIGTTLFRLLIDESNLNEIVTPTSFQTSLTTTYGYDIAVIGDYMYLASSTTTTNLYQIDNSFSIIGTINDIEASPASVGIFGLPGITHGADIYLATCNAAGVYLFTVKYNLASSSSQHISSDDISIGSVTGSIQGTVGAVVPIVYYTAPDPNAGSTTTAIPQNNNINTQVYTSYNGGTGALMCGSAGLVSKAQSLLFNNTYISYVVCAYQSQFQTTYFLYSGDRFAVGGGKSPTALQGPSAKIFPSTAGGLPIRAWDLTTLNLLDSQMLQCALLEQETLSVVNGALYAPTGINSVLFKFGDVATQFSTAVLGNNLMINGGMPQMYDGVNVVEHNFHIFPEGGSLLSAPLGGALSSGVYQYQSIYSWTDNQGQIHQSATSIPLTPSNQINNPAFFSTNDSLDKLGGYVFNASVAIGTNTIFTIAGSAFDPSQLYPGVQIADSSSAFPLNTYITNIAFDTPSSGITQITLNNNSSITASLVTFYATFCLTREAIVEASSSVVEMVGIPYIYQFATFLNGSSDLNMFSTDGIVEGMTIVNTNFISGTSTVTAVDGHTVFMSGVTTAASTIPVALQFSYQFTATTNSSSTNITVTTDQAAYAATKIGGLIIGTNITPGTTIVSASGTTIVMSAVAATSGSDTISIGFPGNIQIYPGQTVQESAPSTYTLDVSFFTSGSPGISDISADDLAFAAANIGAEIVCPGLVTPGTLVHSVTGSLILMTSPAISNGVAGTFPLSVLNGSFEFSGIYTAGSATITGCSAAAVAYAAAHTGDAITSEFIIIFARTIASASGTTITMDAGTGVQAGTSGGPAPFPAATIGPQSPSPFTGLPVVLDSYTDPTNTGVGYVKIDQLAQSVLNDISSFLQFNNTYVVKNTVPTLRITSKLNDLYPVNVVTYRTLSNSIDVSYQVDSSISFPTNDTIEFYDIASDNSLAGGPGVVNSANQLYTAGGVLDNSAGPACSIITTYQNRIVGLNSTNPLQLFYSDQVVPGSPVEFSASYTINVDPRGGDCTSIINMDDKLIIFKENFIFFITGDGPNNLGQQNNFSEAIFIASDCGCVDPKSVVLYPDGVMFKSSKGIMLLSRALKVTYIGAPVEAFNQFNATSAQLIEGVNQVRFTLANTSSVIVYDYFYGLWGTFTNIAAVGSCIFQGLFTWIDSNGVVHQETPGNYTDDGQAIVPHWRTGWMSFSGINGWGRVYEFILLGQYISPHDIQVSISYDFNPNVAQIDTIDASTLIGEPWGSDAWWGESTPWGGDYPTYAWRICPTDPKCTSILIDIKLIPKDPVGESASLSALGFLIGTKKGNWKLPASHTSS